MCINCGPCLQYNNVNYPAIGYFSSYTFRNRKIWGITCDYYILSHQVKTLSSFISFFLIYFYLFLFSYTLFSLPVESNSQGGKCYFLEPIGG